jgi:menaquinone-dependent protoporphyrinogen IX oxidase
MRAAIVFFPQKYRDKLLKISKALSDGIQQNGHQVDIIDGSRDVNTKLTIYEYIAVGSEVVSFIGGKIPESVHNFLSSAGMVGGKRCFAYILKKGFSTQKGLSRLMKEMESQGMYLKYSEVLTSAEEAKEIGKRLHI